MVQLSTLRLWGWVDILVSAVTAALLDQQAAGVFLGGL